MKSLINFILEQQEKGRKKNLDKIFYTTDKNSAKIYAGRAVRRFGGNPIIVRAIPMGDIDVINNKKRYFCIFKSIGIL